MTSDSIHFANLLTLPIEERPTDVKIGGPWHVLITDISETFPPTLMRKVISALGEVEYIVSRPRWALASFLSPFGALRAIRVLPTISFPHADTSTPPRMQRPFTITCTAHTEQLPALLEHLRELMQRKSVHEAFDVYSVTETSATPEDTARDVALKGEVMRILDNWAVYAGYGLPPEGGLLRASEANLFLTDGASE